MTVWWMNEEGESPRWSYTWNADTNEWFERPDYPLRSDHAWTKQGPVTAPDFSKRRGEDYLVSIRCPVCRALVLVRPLPIKCSMCDTQLRQCMRCYHLIEPQQEICPNCGS